MTLGEYIGEQVRKAIAGALQDVKDELTDIAKAGGDAANGGLLGDIRNITDILSSFAGAAVDVAGLLFPPIEVIKAAEAAGGRLGRGYGIGYFLGYAAWQMLSPFVEPLQHGVANLAQTGIFDPDVVARLQAKGIVNEDYGRSEAAGGNLSGEHYDKLVDEAQVRPALVEALQLLNRGEISEADFQLALQRNGIPEFWWGKLERLRYTLPSAADLALALLRGNLEQADAEAMAARVGITPEVLALFEENTGEPIALQGLLEAYRRGFIGQDRLERGIRQSRVRNEWIDVAEKLRYSPMSTADAIEAHVQGHIDEATSRAKTQQNGLEPEDWQALYDTAGQPISREEALRLHHRGLMTIEEVKQAIRESRVKNKYIDNIVELGRQLIPYRTINTIISHGVKSKEWGIEYLKSLGYTEEDATALIDTSAATRSIKAKEITEAQTLALYEQKIISKEEAIKHLEGIGYHKGDAATLVQSRIAQRTLAERNRAITAVRKQYLAVQITEVEASTLLDKLGVLAEERDALLKDWEIELAGEVKTLTAHEIGLAVQYGLWTAAQAHPKLVALGYAPDDATILIDIATKGVPAGTHVPPPRPGPIA